MTMLEDYSTLMAAPVTNLEPHCAQLPDALSQYGLASLKDAFTLISRNIHMFFCCFKR